MTMKHSLLALAFEAGIRPFDPIPAVMAQSRSSGDIAANLLSGRNPYFDKTYRERFGTKVHTIEITHNRLVMGAVESAQPAEGGARRFRAVLFRCDGEVLYQTPDNRMLDQHAALVDLRYRSQHVDESDVLRALCERQVKVASRMKDNAERVITALDKQGAPPLPIIIRDTSNDSASTPKGSSLV